MFEGVSDQIHQFITPRATNSSLPLPHHHHHHHNFPLHNNNNNNSSSPNFNFHPFDNSYQISLQPPHILHPLLHNKNGENHQRDDEDVVVVVESCNNLQVAMAENENERSSSSLMDHHHHHHQWSNDEVLSLLRIRSNMENWFPDSTWEHVSRKLGEVGFRRSAEKCKEKFEEESRYFNNFNFNNNNNKSGRFLSELYHQDQPLFHGGGGGDQENKVLGKQEQEEEREREQEQEEGGVDSRNEKNSNSKSYNKKKKKRMRSSKKEFEILKVFCEDIVKKMMVQQEEIHAKLLHNMLKREEEKISKEESWKKQQMERLHKELEVMANEQAIASDRQATIIEILNQITNSNNFSTFEAKKELKDFLQTMNNATSPSSSSLIQAQISSPTLANSPIMVLANENSSSFTSQNDPKNPNPTPLIKNQTSFSIQKITQNPKSNIEKEFDDLGKRWPRDEVLALVNVRCNLYGNGGDQETNGEGSSSSKAPLWERISQGMLELGYKRSAKRCKEKWENINKYFRKTKDVNKKRSLDSRTCPYFHQLSTLYNQGGSNHVVTSTTTSMKQPDNGLNSSENPLELSENVPTNAC